MSAGTEMEWCREGILTVFTTVDVAALVADRGGIVTVRNAGGAVEDAMEELVSSQEGTLGKRSSISSLTLQSSSFVPAAAAAAATAPAAASTAGSGGGMRGCCCDSRKCGTAEEDDGCSACIAPAGLICSAGGNCRMGSPVAELCCSILMSEFTKTSDASGEDVVGMAATSAVPIDKLLARNSLRQHSSIGSPESTTFVKQDGTHFLDHFENNRTHSDSQGKQMHGKSIPLRHEHGVVEDGDQKQNVTSLSLSLEREVSRTVER